MKISSGVDIVDISRIRKLLDKQSGAANRIFCKPEVEYCNGKGNSKYQSFAARYAAKEAVSKALGTGIGEKCRLKDICVLNKQSGEPYIVLKGNAEKTFVDQNGIDISLSISHERNLAIAYVNIIKGE